MPMTECTTVTHIAQPYGLAVEFLFGMRYPATQVINCS